MGRRRLYVEELEYILFDGYQLPPLTCIVDLKRAESSRDVNAMSTNIHEELLIVPIETNLENLPES